MFELRWWTPFSWDRIMKTFSSLVALIFLATAIARISGAAEPAVVVGPLSPNPPQQPQVTIDGGGAVHIAFGTKSGKAQGDVHYARSDDGGKSFSAPVRVGTVNGLALGMRRGPRIAASGEAVCISAIGH